MGVELKDLEVRFESGRDVLSAYWGYLSDGGLVIPGRDGLIVGEDVSLQVLIASAQARYSLAGRVVRLDPGRGAVTIAFSPGQPHDMLLTQALADADQVPARRARRFRVDLPAQVEVDEPASAFSARLLDVSELGCCMQVYGEAGNLGIGRGIGIVTEEFSVRGRIVWARRDERGVLFIDRQTDTDDRIREFVRGLAPGARGTTPG